MSSEYMDVINQTETSTEYDREKCCAKCRYFEERTCFCRYNPPVPIVTYLKNGQSFVTSVYSKINIPQLDWCQKFEQAK